MYMFLNIFLKMTSTHLTPTENVLLLDSDAEMFEHLDHLVLGCAAHHIVTHLSTYTAHNLWTEIQQ